MKNKLYGLMGAAMLLVPVVTTAADDERSYTEGTVLDVTAVRTKPGMFDTYLKWLSSTYKPMMEEEKKAGIIVSYAVYSGFPRTPNDPDLYLVTQFKNMAALDDMDAKVDPISKKYWATMAAADKAEADRESIRQILGDELMRELKLK